MIDGGKGQIAVAANVLEEQGMHGVPLMGLPRVPNARPGRRTSCSRTVRTC